MITSRETYQAYLQRDKVALRINTSSLGSWIRNHCFNDIWRFEKLLRKLEFYHNCRKHWIYAPYKVWLKLRFKDFSTKLGFTIPINTFGPGLSIAHVGTIVVNPNARIGENCRIHVCVNIGTQAGPAELAPKIGNSVYIAPGAKIFGDIQIADGIAIGANAVVNKSFLEENITIAGIPAKKISDKGTHDFFLGM